MGQQSATVIDPSAPLAFADVQFSRNQEQDSDKFALELVHQRYGHVAHALDFFRRLQDENFDPISAQNYSLSFLQLIRFRQPRIQDLENYAKRKGWALDGEPQPLLIVQE